MNYDVSSHFLGLAAVFDGMQDAVLIHDLDGNIFTVNPAIKDVLNYEPQDLLGLPVSVLIPDDLLEEQERLLRQILNGERVRQYRTVRLNANGNAIPVSLSLSPIKDNDDRIIGASQIVHDIAKEIEAEVALNRLAAIIEGSQDAIISKTLEGIITSWNPAAESMFGYTDKEAIGRPITILIPDERLHEEEVILGKIRRGEKIAHFETIRKTKNGDLVPISLTVSPVRDHGGRIVGVSKIARNISSRRLAEEREANLAAVVDSSDDAIIGITITGLITSWNKGAERILGYTEEEVIGKDVSLIIPEDRIDEKKYILKKVRKGSKVEHFPTIRKTKNGTLITMSLTVSPVRNGNGTVIGASKMARDITREQIGHETMRQYAERLQILNSMAKTISEKLDVKDILQKVTDATTQLVGAEFGAFFYNIKDQSGESYMLYTLAGAPREAFEKFGMPRNTAVFHPTFSGEGVVRVDDIKKDPRYGKMAPHFGMPKGHLPVTSYLAVPVFTGGGDVIGGLFFGHSEAGRFTVDHEDLVVSMASQAGVALDNSLLFEHVQLLSRKKDEFIELATHELKTPLTSVSGFLQIVHAQLKNDPVNQSFVQKSMNQLRRLIVLVNDLFDVSKIQAGKMQFELQDMDMTEVAAELIEMQKQTATHEITLKADGPTYLHADRMRVEQVLANFINNAVKYSPNGGAIEVIIEDRGHEVCVSVVDQGLGISPENIKYIFSQFYREDRVSTSISGLGLGLYISKEIIERHGGTVHVKSELGKGSTFTFCLPKFPRQRSSDNIKFA